MTEGLVAQLKARWSILAVLELVGLAESRKGMKFLCPAHADTNPSAHLYLDQDRWQCFACDEGGDQLDLFAASQGIPLADAIAALATEAGIDHRQDWGTTRRPPSPAQDVLAVESKAQLEVLRTLARDFPSSRGKEAWVSLVEAAFWHHDEIMRRYRNRELKPEATVELLLVWWKWMTGGEPHKGELLALFSTIGDDRSWREITGALRPEFVPAQHRNPWTEPTPDGPPDPGTHPGGPPGTPPSKIPRRRQRPSLMGGAS